MVLTKSDLPSPHSIDTEWVAGEIESILWNGNMITSVSVPPLAGSSISIRVDFGAIVKSNVELIASAYSMLLTI